VTGILKLENIFTFKTALMEQQQSRYYAHVLIQKYAYDIKVWMSKNREKRSTNKTF